MKKIIAAFIAAVMTCGVVFAQEAEVQVTPAEQPVTNNAVSASYGEVSFLISQGLFKNSAAIHDKSIGLSSNERALLYSQYKKSSVLPFCLNFFLPFSVGSYVQGDITTGVIGTVADIVYPVAMFAVVCMDPEVQKVIMSQDSSTIDTSKIQYSSSTLIAAGSMTLVYAVWKIAQCVSPFIYTAKYNNTLSSSLGSSNVSMQAIPVVGKDNNLGMQMTFKIKL